MECVLDAARGGGPGVMFLVGEAGLGKTSLVRHCCAVAEASGFQSVAAGCSQAESTLPFGLLDRLLPGDAGAPTGRDGGHGDHTSREARLSSYSRALAWVRSAAADGARPLLVAVDDLHWADSDSLEILSLLCRRLGGLGVAFVAALRPWPPAAHSHVTALVSEGWAHSAKLEPLSDEASEALLAECLGSRPPAQLVERALSACAGNPLLLKAVADSELDSTDLLSAGASGLAHRLLVPRFAGVGPEALRWARAASIFGTRHHVQLVGRLAGQSPLEAAEALQALCDAGLVEGGPDGMARFAHPLFGQVLYESVPPPVTQAMHARAFRLLMAAGMEPAEASPHAVRGRLFGDREALGALVEAGRSALAAGAVGTAVRHFEDAILLSPHEGLPGDAWLDLAEAYLATGQVARAGQVLRRALGRQGLAAPERAAALVLTGEAVRGAASLAEPHRYFVEAAELARTFDPTLAVRLSLDVAFVDWYFVGPTRARASARQVLAAGAGPGGGAGEVEAACADAYLALLEGDAGGVASIEEAAKAELHSLPRPPAWRWDVVNAWANVARFTERFEESEAVSQLLMEQARQQGAALSYHMYAVAAAFAYLRTGRLDLARPLLAEAAEMAELLSILAPFSHSGLAFVFQELGAQRESASWTARARGILDGAPTPRDGDSPTLGAVYPAMWLDVVECRAAMADGRVGDAATLAARLARTAAVTGLREPCAVPWHGVAVEALVAAGRLEEAQAVVVSLAEVLAGLPCRGPRAVERASRALLAWRGGRSKDADALFRQAVKESSAAPLPLLQCEILISYARFLRQHSQMVPARQLLHEALELAGRHGGGRLSLAAQEELAAAGGRRRMGAVARTSLSEQERRVAELAAAGLTNLEIAGRLFLSAKTVEHHLSRVYAKLGVRSRRDLMLGWPDAGQAAASPAARAEVPQVGVRAGPPAGRP